MRTNTAPTTVSAESFVASMRTNTPTTTVFAEVFAASMRTSTTTRFAFYLLATMLANSTPTTSFTEASDNSMTANVFSFTVLAIASFAVMLTYTATTTVSAEILWYSVWTRPIYTIYTFSFFIRSRLLNLSKIRSLSSIRIWPRIRSLSNT